MVRTEGNSERMKRDNPMFNNNFKKKRLDTIKEKGNWGECNIGKKRPDLTKRNLENNPMNNIETRKKAYINHSKTMKEKYKNLEEKQKFNKRMLNSQHKRPTLPEKIMINLIKENNLPFNYTGNGKIFISGFNPDFLSKNPKHIIEVNGDYWHNLPNIKEKDKRKYKSYAKYGYKTLIIWEKELKNPVQVIDKINKFMGGKK